MALKKFALALSDCQTATSIQHDSSAKTLIRLARCHMSLGQGVQAHLALNKILQQDGAGTSSSTNAAAAAAAASFTAAEKEAAKQLDSQVKRMVDALETYTQSRGERKWTMASIALDRAIQEIGGSSDSSEGVPYSWRVWKAELAVRKGQLEMANGLATDLLRADSSQPEALILRSQILMSKGEIAKAIQHAQAALRSDPDSKTARRLMKKCKLLDSIKTKGNEAFKRAQYAEAVETYTEAITEADADSGDAEMIELKGFKATLFSNRATAKSKLADYEGTVSDCDEALQLDAGYVKALRTRARAFSQLEKYEEAVRDFKEAMEESGEADASLQNELRQAEIDLKRSKKKE